MAAIGGPAAALVPAACGAAAVLEGSCVGKGDPSGLSGCTALAAGAEVPGMAGSVAEGIVGAMTA